MKGMGPGQAFARRNFQENASRGVITGEEYKLSVEGTGISPDGFKSKFEALGGEGSARVTDLTRLVRRNGNGSEFFAVSVEGKTTPEQAIFVSQHAVYAGTIAGSIHDWVDRVGRPHEAFDAKSRQEPSFLDELRTRFTGSEP